MAGQVMTIRKIEKALKHAEKTDYAMASDGDLPAFKIRGQLRVRSEDFQLRPTHQAGSSQSSPDVSLESAADQLTSTKIASELLDPPAA